ncbi:uncharacterized protein LOC118746541 [Rhagoletis pomonella]|uniref:uncharacterized protein LOC118746541 n=1 Tax=Rhagoletis pomonella TaxID=28610 RepID=UPI00177F6527|nr:uncharacterized protein LOC118746541 [Rhagoletis pomonella]
MGTENVFGESAGIYFVVDGDLTMGNEVETSLQQSQATEASREKENLKDVVCGKMNFSEEVYQRILGKFFENLRGTICIFMLLTDCGMDVESLYFINDGDINELFPASMLGTRVKFKERVARWRQNEADTISSIGSCKSWINSSQESHDSIRDMEAKNLKLILNATERGQSIFKQYREKTVLSDVSRDILVNTIVDHFSARSVPMTMKDIITFSEQITILFPNEDMRYYCNRRNGKNPTGKLYDKATNIRRKIKKETGALSVAPKCQPTQSSLSEQASNTDENDLAMKNLLCHNVEPWGDVVEKWTNTVKLRTAEILNEHANILTNWPLLKHSLGYTLVEIDFEAKFPNCSQNLLNEWPKFRKSIIPYMKTKIRDATSIDMLKKIDENISTDSMDCLLTLLLHAILKPSLISVGQTSGEKRLKWKPSICDAQAVTLLHCSSINDYQRMYHELKIKLNQKNLPLQPLLLVVGEKLTQLDSFYVIFDSIIYKVPTFLKSLDTLFKIFHVLNLEYPIQAKSIYNFIESYFFGIADCAHPNVITLKNYLKDTQNLLE